MSQINVNRIKDSNEGAPDFPSGVNVGGITSTVTLGVTNLNPTNLNVSGVVTATTLDGNLLATGTPTLGLGVTINTSGVNISGVATAGIVSATTLYGDGSNLTGIGLSIAPLNYNPAVGGLFVGSGTGIGITFNQAVKAGSGNVTLRIAGAAGTVVENFGVGNSVTYSNGDTITITPTSSLSSKETYYLSYPSGAFTNIGGDVSYVGTAYTFITVGGQLWSMGGFNVSGALGINLSGTGSPGYTNAQSSPVQVTGLEWSKYIANGTYTSGAVKNNNELWMWGANTHGGLGQNNRTTYSSPVQVPGTTWKQLSFSTDSIGTGALKTDGTLWGWGLNEFGNLGHNSTAKYSSPVQVGSDTTWKQISMSGSNTLATKTDGTLWTWGNNAGGQLGLSQPVPTNISSPTQIPGTTWANISANNSRAMATKTDGTLWSWGYNENGALGQNDRTEYSSPKQIPGTTWGTGYGTLATNVRASAAIKTDGTLWAWGYNAYGGLGQNNREYYSSPVQIPGTTWTSIGRINYAFGATKSDGTLWVWGSNSIGQLGLNQGGNPGVSHSSPVQVGSDTTWKFASPESDFTLMVYKEL